MEVWQYLEILRESGRTWFFGKEKNQDKKLIALNKLSEIGYPSIINNLIPFLRDGSEELRNGTIQTITELFSKLKGKKAYYDSLKHCSISEQDIVYYESRFDIEEFNLLMKISSLNGNGYIREKAVRELGKSQKESVIPFIIFRLADWVPEVRQVAKEELAKFIRPEFQQELINNLSLFDWLQKIERTNLSEIYNEVIDFLVINNRSEKFKSFLKTNDKERRIFAKELSKKIQSNDEINYLLKDKYFLIRIIALNHFDKLTDSQKEKLLNDKSARVRQSTLYKFKGNEHFEKLLTGFLSDKSGNIRHLSRFYLKGKEIDFKEFYLGNLNKERQVIGSMLGLLEIEAKNCDDFIEPYLESDKLNVVKTAFYVLSNLNSDKAFNFAKTHMFTNQIGLRNQIFEYLGRTRNREILEIARKHYQEDGEHLKLSILKLYSRIGGYSVFPDLLIGTIDKSESIRNQASLYIKKWRDEAVRMYIEPNEVEKNRAIKVFNFVNEAHMEKKYFNSNPVEGLDFYIK